ncbi:MAG: glutamine amidotransferase [Rhodospirillales bacterium]|nr:glutamine amidotransferase [Rhodospirillales bacterium]
MKLLVVDGNTRATNALHQSCGGQGTSVFYAGVLRHLAADASIDEVHPADAGVVIGLADYDGIVWTGSALNAWLDEPPVRRQVELMRAAFITDVPVFGSCWGLQVATVAAGGAVLPARNGRELGVARDITLNGTGRNHPMFAGKPDRFDAIAVHGDEIGGRPATMTVLADNGHSSVQAAEISRGGGFWGTQYHPEYDLHEIATVMLRYGDRLLEDGTFADAATRDRAVSDLRALAADPARQDLAASHGIGATVLDPVQRRREIANWLTAKVRPAISRRSRG